MYRDFWILGPKDLRKIQIRQLISAHHPCCSTSNDSAHQAEQEFTINFIGLGIGVIVSLT